MRNVHERVIAAPAEAVGVLLDGLGSDRDRLWPAPAWPPMQFDRPLGVGADGGHDEIRYAVSAYEPGRRVTFRFHPVTGLDGFHALEVEPIDGATCVLRHVLEAQPRGRMRLLTPTVVRWLHDAVVEDLLDNAERAATGTVARPYRYSVWVRLLRWFSSPGARAATVPRHDAGGDSAGKGRLHRRVLRRHTGGRECRPERLGGRLLRRHSPVRRFGYAPSCHD
ncbi:MAG: hypothetical protein WKF47_05360 [Geodermatophilaceae bacterium]